METGLTKIMEPLSPDQRNYLEEQFKKVFEIITPVIEKAKTLIVTSIDQKDLMQQAHEGRIILKNKRNDVEKMRKELKERSLREGQAIDKVANLIKEMIAPAEAHLELQENFAKIYEEQRKEALRLKRHEILLPYTSDPSLFDLANMTEEQFDQILAGQKAAHEQRIEAEKKAEEDRIAKERAEAEERECIRRENERLKAEVEKREAELAEERRKAEVERKRLEYIAKAEAEKREAAEREIHEEQQKKQAEMDRIKAEEERAAAAPDKEKLIVFAGKIEALQLEFPELSSKKMKAVRDGVLLKLREIHAYIYSSL